MVKHLPAYYSLPPSAQTPEHLLIEHFWRNNRFRCGNPAFLCHLVSKGQKAANPPRNSVFRKRWLRMLPKLLQRSLLVRYAQFPSFAKVVWDFVPKYVKSPLNTHAGCDGSPSRPTQVCIVKVG